MSPIFLIIQIWYSCQSYLFLHDSYIQRKNEKKNEENSALKLALARKTAKVDEIAKLPSASAVPAVNAEVNLNNSCFVILFLIIIWL